MSHPKLKAESIFPFGCLPSFLVSGAIILLCLWANFGFDSEYQASVRLQKEGIQIAAKIIDKTVSSDCAESTCNEAYTITYATRTADQQLLRATDTVDNQTYDQLQIGDPWPILYASTYPPLYTSLYRYATPEQLTQGRDALRRGLLRYVFPVFIFLFLILALVWLRTWRFQRKSVLTQGVITHRWQEQFHDDGQTNFHSYIAYTFPAGQETKKAVNATRYNELNIGDPVTVRYLPSNPRRSRPEGL